MILKVLYFNQYKQCLAAEKERKRNSILLFQIREKSGCKTGLFCVSNFNSFINFYLILRLFLVLILLPNYNVRGTLVSQQM